MLIEPLAVILACAADADLVGQPLVVLRGWDQTVLAVSAEVEGVGRGDSAQRVAQVCPAARVIEADEMQLATVQGQLRAALEPFGGPVETVDWGALMVGAPGRGWPDMTALAEAMRSAIEAATGLTAVVGVAADRFTAEQAARQTDAVRVVAVGRSRLFLAGLPVTALPDPPMALVQRLRLFGIETLGALAALPVAAVALQFADGMAEEARFFHALARGEDGRGIQPDAPEPRLDERLVLVDAVAERPRLWLGLERLVDRLAARLAAGGYSVVGLTVTLETEDGQVETRGRHLKPPSVAGPRLKRVAARLLGECVVAAPVTAIALAAYPLRPWQQAARQLTLLDRRSPQAALWATIGRLKQRFGRDVIRLASRLGPPLPLPVSVVVDWQDAPAEVQFVRWRRAVQQVYEQWREARLWWTAQPCERVWYRVEAQGGLVLSLFRDGDGRWWWARG